MSVVTRADRDLCSARPREVDHTRTAALHYLGHYVRRLPVSMERMMENALDWEHLSHVHASSFASIECVEAGSWGWRAVTTGPDGEGRQVLELLVDLERHYWATAVLSGPAAEVEIHTQASAFAEHEIEVDVRFYSATALDEATAALYLDVLQQQYALLYDEDEALMTGRQAALDERRRWSEHSGSTGELLVGERAALLRQGGAVVTGPRGRYCVRRYRDDWVVYSAVCPHLLGPLDDAVLADDGSVRCPWHGYRFDVASGDNLDDKCRGLAAAPALVERDGRLYLVDDP